MLNNTSSFYRPKQIDFQVMGLDSITSDFLNWCVENRNNLEFLKLHNAFDKKSQSEVLHFDHLKEIKIIEDVIKHERA